LLLLLLLLLLLPICSPDCLCKTFSAQMLVLWWRRGQTRG